MKPKMARHLCNVKHSLAGIPNKNHHMQFLHANVNDRDNEIADILPLESILLRNSNINSAYSDNVDIITIFITIFFRVIIIPLCMLELFQSK